MSLFEAYSFLFFDSLMSVMVFVPNTTMVFHVMNIFGYQKYYIIFVATLGSLAGVSINYLFGKILNYIKQKQIGESEKYVRLRSLTQKRLYFLSALSFIPIVGVVVTVFLGLMRASFKRFITAALIGRLLYYLVIS